MRASSNSTSFLQHARECFAAVPFGIRRHAMRARHLDLEKNSPVVSEGNTIHVSSSCANRASVRSPFTAEAWANCGHLRSVFTAVSANLYSTVGSTARIFARGNCFQCLSTSPSSIWNSGFNLSGRCRGRTAGCTQMPSPFQCSALQHTADDAGGCLLRSNRPAKLNLQWRSS